MRAAFVTDTHFGYRRFEEDALSQGKEAILAASREADFLVLGGDNFDTPLPRMETLSEVTKVLREASEIFRSRGLLMAPAGEKDGIVLFKLGGTEGKPPIFAIHGNHDRRAKGYVHPTELLMHGGFAESVHNKTVAIEKDGERVAISGMGNVPDDMAREGIGKLSCKPVSGAFNIFVLHQSFQEFDIAKNEQFITFDDLPDGFDLYLCGHIHKPNLSGKVLNPGSTIVTQLREDEVGQRGWLFYDTKGKAPKFVPIASRQLFHTVLRFEKATPEEIRSKIIAEAARLSSEGKLNGKAPLVKIVVKGTLAEGFHAADLSIPELGEGVFVDNSLNSENLRERILQIKDAREKKKSPKEMGMEILRAKLKGTPYSLGDPEVVFESLLEGKFLAELKEKIEKEGKGGG